MRALNFLPALIAALPAAFANYIAWGEWGCGLMGFQAAAANLIFAVGASITVWIWPEWRFSKLTKRQVVLIICGTAIVSVIGLVFCAPQCPYAAR